MFRHYRDRRAARDDEIPRPTPTVVTTAVSVGTAPLPFIAVYAVLFLLHGLVHPVHPPDIGNSPHQETIAGIITAVIFVLGTASLVMFLNRARRWFFALFQLLVLAGSMDVLVDSTRGGRPVAGLLVATTVVALFCGFAPEGWAHVGLRAPRFVEVAYHAVGVYPRPPKPKPEDRTSLPGSSDPTVVMPAALRRQHDRMG